MRFGPVPLDQAEGAVLAHSVALPGGRLRKGAVLGRADLARLEAAGIAEVVVAQPGPGDVGEDAAAARLAAALVPDTGAAGLRLGPAATGRVNVFAEAAGVLRIDRAAIDRVNAVDPGITVATVPEWQAFGLSGGMAATVKIIPYAVEAAALAAAEATGRGALALEPVRLRHAVLIETEIDGREGGKGRQVTAERLARFGVRLGPETRVAHERGALEGAIREAEGDLVLILTGSATSDVEDVAPGALRDAGGSVTRFGMPVDPGNLLFLGEIGGRPVIGLPGCARSPARNGVDMVLERVICGLPPGSAEIAAMGVGGLLKEVPERGRRREG